VIEHDARELGRRATRLLLDEPDSPASEPVIETIPVSVRVVVPEPASR
jgi:hypothetical protein